MISIVGRSLYTNCSPDWSWTVQSLPDYDLWFVYSGRGTMDLNGGKLSLSAGKVILLEPGSRILAGKEPRDKLQVYSAHFLADDDDSLGPIAGRLIDVGDRVFFRNLFLRHLKRDVNGSGQHSLWLEAMLRELMEWRSQYERKKSSYLQGRMEEISLRIIEHPEKDWTIDGLAEEAALCKDHFIRVFKEFKGRTPGQFLIEARLARAGELLTESDLPVYRIAELCGFESAQWFCRLFRKKKGISPGKYRMSYFS